MFFSDSNLQNNLRHHAHYRHIHQDVSLELDVSLVMSVLEDNLGFRPLACFSNLIGYQEFKLILNPFKRDIVYQSLHCSRDDFLQKMLQRLSRVAVIDSQDLKEFQPLEGLSHLPVLKHQPKDAGHYLTSAITATRALNDSKVNLGIYRIQQIDERRGHIFLDPKSDGYKNVMTYHQVGESCPVTITIGNEPIAYIVAAGNIKGEYDDLGLIAQLAARPLHVSNTEVPAPLSASVVIEAHITLDKGVEAQFGEFKGFYCEPRLAPVLEVDSIKVHSDKIYCGLVAGKESGLNLMALRNEVNMYVELKRLNFFVLNVRYTCEGKGEFICHIVSPAPSRELADAAMEIDPRVKFFIISTAEDTDWTHLALFPFELVQKPYYRRNKREGERMCAIQTEIPRQVWCEY